MIDRLARDLRAALAEAWPDGEFVQQPAAQLQWFHLCTLLDRVKNTPLREWYAAQALAHGWSRNVLVMQVEPRLHERQGHAVSNFAERLPPVHSDLACDALKDPDIASGAGARASPSSIRTCRTR
ncbi:DUF1016 N-terminal domain-containing protein [Cupriavidus necator]